MAKAQGEGAGLAHLIGGVVEVITNDGRVIKGIFRGYDQVTNLILEDCCELVFSTSILLKGSKTYLTACMPELTRPRTPPQAGVQMAELGLQVMRGDNIAVIGEVDEDVYDQLDLNSIRAAPLQPIGH